MLKQCGGMLVVALVVATLIVFGIRTSSASPQRADPPRRPDNFVVGEAGVKEMLYLMDSDRDGKVSKEEFMGFMHSVFDRLDAGQTGQLDIKELTESKWQRSHFARVGK